MTKYFLLLSASVLLLSCGNPETEEDKTKEEQGFEMVQHHFRGDKFTNQDHLALLEELDICDMNLNDSTSVIAKCSPENFEIYPIDETKSVKDAFLLQTKSMIILKGSEMPLPVRHIMIFERENGSLVRVNGFRGELIARETGKGSAMDLYIAIYYKPDETMFTCKFYWNGSKYSFENVVSMDWGEGPKAVKESMKDSVSREIYQSLMDAKLLF